EMDVRRAPGVEVVAPRVFAGPDGDETIAALGVGNRAAGAREIRIERRVVLVGAMRVAAGGVRLPDLDQGVGHGAAVLVEHAAGDDDALADRIALVLARQIAVRWLDVAMAENRPGDLRECLRRQNQRLSRAALLRRAVGRIVVGRLSAG